MSAHWRRHRLGAEALLIESDQETDAELCRRLGAAARRLREHPAIRDAVPAYSSVALFHTPDLSDAALLRLWDEAWTDADSRAHVAEIYDIRVRYDGLDLADCAAVLGISTAELIERHSAPCYTVAMIGFRPHFPYLLGLDPTLRLPRRRRPRASVPAGSVAIADAQAGIYPEDSPGGWHCLGRTDPAVCRRLEPGMQLRFRPVAVPAGTAAEALAADVQTEAGQAAEVRLHLNCDAGERGIEHPGDLRLLRLVDACNIACGGHAGDAQCARRLAELAAAEGVDAHLHLAYPDREHFGRRSLTLPWSELRDALARQRAVLPDSRVCKLHGALYNDTVAERELAERVAQWLRANAVDAVLAPPDSAMAWAASAVGLEVITEGFADRRYRLHAGRPVLMPRERPDALHNDPERAVAQVRSVLETGLLDVEDDGRIRQVRYHRCASWCVHSDTPTAEAVATALRGWRPRC